MFQIGKREFALHTSRYLNKIERTGEELLITDRNVPCLKVVPIKPKTIRGLRGLITEDIDAKEVNTPVLPAFDQW